MIGKGGEMIKKLQQETGAKIVFLNLNEDGPEDRRCSISGNEDAVQSARQRIQELVENAMVRLDFFPSVHFFIICFPALLY